MIVVESGLSKELGGSIKTNKTSSNDKGKDNLPQIQEDDHERYLSIPNAGNYESIKKDNNVEYSS